MEITQIPVKKIILDQRNPRIAHAMEGIAGAVNPDWITLALGHAAPEDEERGTSTTYSSLKASIRANKGLINPIIVSPKADGSYVAIEGNTRVAIYLELAGEGVPGNWDTIPAVVRPEMAEQDEHAIRLQAHLVGPRPWRPYAKAKYLNYLYAHQKLSITELLDFCGGTGRRAEIQQYIDAYKDMQETYMPLALAAGSPPDYTLFSSFAELQNIKPALARAGVTLQQFAEWVHDSKLSPQQTVRQLPRILANPEAKRQFLAHNAREALKVLDQPSSNAIVANASLEQLATALSVKIRQLNWSEVQSLMQAKDSSASLAVLGCYDELKTLAEMLSNRANG
jgi:ParB/Sulfiredoxin domain